MSLLRLRRPVGVLLALSLTLSGCSAVHVHEHDHPAGSAVSVRVVWDDAGTSRLVGGVKVSLARLGPAPPAGPARHLTATTDPRARVDFGELEPGRYRVTLSGPGLRPVERTFDLEPYRRVSVRVDVEAREAPRRVYEDLDASTSAGDVALHVLKGVGLVLAVVTIVGVVLIIGGLLDADDDDEPCGPCRGHRRWTPDDNCRCACHV